MDPRKLPRLQKRLTALPNRIAHLAQHGPEDGKEIARAIEDLALAIWVLDQSVKEHAAALPAVKRRFEI